MFNFQVDLNHDILLNNGHKYHYKYLQDFYVFLQIGLKMYVNSLN